MASHQSSLNASHKDEDEYLSELACGDDDTEEDEIKFQPEGEESDDMEEDESKFQLEGEESVEIEEDESKYEPEGEESDDIEEDECKFQLEGEDSDNTEDESKFQPEGEENDKEQIKNVQQVLVPSVKLENSDSSNITRGQVENSAEPVNQVTSPKKRDNGNVFKNQTSNKVKYAKQPTPICDAIMEEYSRRQELLRTHGISAIQDLPEITIEDILKKIKVKVNTEKSGKKVPFSPTNLPEGAVLKTFSRDHLKTVQKGIKNVNSKVTEKGDKVNSPKGVRRGRGRGKVLRGALQRKRKSQSDEENSDEDPDVANSNEIEEEEHEDHLQFSGEVTDVPSSTAVGMRRGRGRGRLRGKSVRGALQRKRKSQSDDSPEEDPDVANPKVIVEKGNGNNLDYSVNEVAEVKPEVLNPLIKIKQEVNDMVVSSPTASRSRRGRGRGRGHGRGKLLGGALQRKRKSQSDEDSPDEDPAVDQFAEKIKSKRVTRTKKAGQRLKSLAVKIADVLEKQPSQNMIDENIPGPVFIKEKCAFILNLFTTFQEVFDKYTVNHVIPILIDKIMFIANELTDSIQRTKQAETFDSVDLKEQEILLAKQSYLKAIINSGETFFPFFNHFVEKIVRTKTSKALFNTLILYIAGFLFLKTSKIKLHMHSIRRILHTMTKACNYHGQFVSEVLHTPDESFDSEIKLIRDLLKYFQSRKFLEIPPELLCNHPDVRFEEEQKFHAELLMDTAILEQNKPIGNILSQNNDQLQIPPLNIKKLSKCSDITAEFEKALESEQDDNTKIIKQTMENILSSMSGNGANRTKSQMGDSTAVNYNVRVNLGKRVPNIPTVKLELNEETNEEQPEWSRMSSLNRQASLSDVLDNKFPGWDSLCFSYLKASTERPTVEIKAESVDLTEISEGSAHISTQPLFIPVKQETTNDFFCEGEAIGGNCFSEEKTFTKPEEEIVDVNPLS